MTSLRTIVGAAVLALATSQAVASPALAPFPHTKFCMQQPLDCKVWHPRSIPDLARRVKDRAEVNKLVNGFIKADAFPDGPVRSPVTERWLIWPERGDCNDYAVTKRHELLRRGWPSSLLQLAVVFVPASNEYHLVLIADGVVMDNLTEKLLPFANTGYTLVKLQTVGNPVFWEKP
jgi:predicted transglutaminase-like cysteine proteinase